LQQEDARATLSGFILKKLAEFIDQEEQASGSSLLKGVLEAAD